MLILASKSPRRSDLLTQAGYQFRVEVSDAEEINDRIATMACKAAIKGNMSFTVTEARALIDELLRLDNPYNCPHRRPTIVAYSKYEIEKLFKRIV